MKKQANGWNKKQGFFCNKACLILNEIYFTFT